MKQFKAKITSKEYVEQQIQKILDSAVTFEAQKNLLMKAVADDDKKEKAIKAITAIDAQLEAGQNQLKLWVESYRELEEKGRVVTIVKKKLLTWFSRIHQQN